MKNTILQLFGILVVYAGAVVVTHSYVRHADASGYEADRLEWMVAQNAAWTGDPSKTDLENETMRILANLTDTKS